MWPNSQKQMIRVLTVCKKLILKFSSLDPVKEFLLTNLSNHTRLERSAVFYFMITVFTTETDSNM